MRKTLKIMAVVMLLVTMAAAGAAIYGVMMMAPKLISVTANVTPAVQAQEMYDEVMRQAAQGVLDGRVVGDTSQVTAQNSAFITYSVRLDNKGFFPAEWISVKLTPLGGDVLVIGGSGANVLTPGAQGDIAVTLLTCADPQQTGRGMEIECYVFGRKQTVYAGND